VGGVHKVLAVAVALAALGGNIARSAPASAATATPVLDAPHIALAFAWAVDVERGERGLPALYLDQVEASAALHWSTVMASADVLAHDPRAQASVAAADPGWRNWGENVGVGPTPQAVEAALMASPGHRANILGNYTRMGIGVVVAAGNIWVTERFYR